MRYGWGGGQDDCREDRKINIVTLRNCYCVAQYEEVRKVRYCYFRVNYFTKFPSARLDLYSLPSI